MKDIIKITRIADQPTAKGNLVITCSLTRGLMTEDNYFFKTVPEVAEANNLEVGQNVTDLMGNYKIEQSEVQDRDDPEKTIVFNWLKPA